MPNLISKWLRGRNNEVDEERKHQIIVSATQGEMVRGDTETEVAWKKDLSIRYEVLHDDDCEDILAQKVLKPIKVPDLDAKGNIQYMRDEKGTIITDANGTPFIKYKDAVMIDNTFAAIRNMISHVNRCVFLDPKNVRLAQLVMEDIIEDAKMSLPERDFDLGLGSYLDSQWNNMFFLTNDAANGNKVKALLELRTIKTLDVNAGPRQEKKGVF